MAPSKNSPTKPSDRAEWLILTSVQSAERGTYLLGSVVPNAHQYNPFDGYSPHWADPDLNAIAATGEDKKAILRRTMKSLRRAQSDFGDGAAIEDDTPVQLTDVVTGKVAAKTKEMRAIVTNVFNIFLCKDQVEEVEILAGTVFRYTVDNPQAKVPDILMPCAPWKEQLQKLFDRTVQQESPFFLVTGILVCKDLEVRWKRNSVSDLNAEMKVDGNAILLASGLPPNPQLAKYLDNKFNFNQKKSTKENVFATCKHEVIFAIRYNYLNLTFEKDLNAKEPRFFTKWMSKSAKPGTIKNAKMGKVVLGTGIMAFATAVSNENKEERKNGDVTDTEEEEEEDASLNWFYSRPATGLRSGSEDEEGDDHAVAQVQQNGSAGAILNGRA